MEEWVGTWVWTTPRSGHSGREHYHPHHCHHHHHCRCLGSPWCHHQHSVSQKQWAPFDTFHWVCLISFIFFWISNVCDYPPVWYLILWWLGELWESLNIFTAKALLVSSACCLSALAPGYALPESRLNPVYAAFCTRKPIHLAPVGSLFGV